MRWIKFIVEILNTAKNRKGSCPKCGGWIDEDDDCCQDCGYPWSD
jgi:predicted amidophosphoribosyltransferase